MAQLQITGGSLLVRGFVFIALVSVLLVLGYRDLAQDETTTVAIGMAVVGTLGVILFLMNLAVAPYSAHEDVSLAKKHLEDLRRPTLQFILPSSGTASVAFEGSVVETYGGNRCVEYTRWSDTAVYLLVTNFGELKATGCRARVLWAARERGDGSLDSANIIESIELPWRKDNPDENLTADIAPNDTARIWIANVRQGGNLWVNRKDIPLHYARVFGDEGLHRLLLQVDGENFATTQLLLEIRTEKAKPPEKGFGAWEPSATVTMLGQGGPMLMHPDLPKRLEADVATRLVKSD